MQMWKAGLKWMFLIMGTTIGAGYASGRELWQFFGHESVLAIFLFTILFISSCNIILRISFEQETIHYIPVLKTLVGKKLTGIYDFMILLYLYSTTVVMLAGGGATLNTFHFPYWSGVGVIVILLVLLFFWDVKGMLSMNSLLIPILVVLLLGILLYFLVNYGNGFPLDLEKQSNWPSAFTFTSLNILPLIAVLSAIGQDIKQKGEIWIASLGSGVILGGISFLYNQSLITVSSDIILYEIPLFAILKQFPYFMIIVMSVLLWAAIYTTAASGVFGIISRFRSLIKWPFWLLALLLLLTMIPLTSFGFATLVSVLYPIYGVLNLYVLAAILIQPIIWRSNLS
jgi:uncharacterized membrane protein YkvI